MILGFDGMDPRLVQRWMDQGRLPNMQKLAKLGSGVQPLGTTHSPESPTAWASFATGVNAGKHNIYDFLVRDTNTYLPDLGMVTRQPPRFVLNFIPVSKPVISPMKSPRTGFRTGAMLASHYDACSGASAIGTIPRAISRSSACAVAARPMPFYM